MAKDQINAAIAFMADEERRQLLELKFGAKQRYSKSGRSVSPPPFGFRRRPDKSLEPLADELRVVRRAHEILAENEGEGGLSAIEAALKAEGTPLSAKRLARILRDPAYVTGQVMATYRGSVYPLSAVQLPVPLALDVFEDNQRRLKMTASQRRTRAADERRRTAERTLRALGLAKDAQQRGNRSESRLQREDEAAEGRPSSGRTS